MNSTIYNNSSKESKEFDYYYLKLQSAYKTGDKDLEALIQLVYAAMGKRSQRKFAEDLGVNVSSVSRILNGKVSDVSDILLAKIAATADPDSNVTIDKLMAAQGIVEPNSKEQYAYKFEESCRMIIANELLKRGYSVSYSKMPIKNNRLLYDFELITDALPNGDGRWLIETSLMYEKSSIGPSIGKFERWLDSAMAAYYRGEQIGRVSLVVDNKASFYQLKERIKKITITDEISIILISLGKGSVIDEFVLRVNNGSKLKFSFAERI